MQYCDTTSYQTPGLYATSQSYDGSTIKLHHGHFPESGPAEACYNTFFNNVSSPGSYIPREPPSYAESTVFHTGFPQTNSNNSYYKHSPGETMPDFTMQRNNNNDQLLSKSDLLESNSLDINRFDSDSNRLIVENDIDLANTDTIKIEATDNQNISSSSGNDSIVSPGNNSVISSKDDKESEKLDLESPDKGHDEKARGNADVKPAMSYIALIAKAILETAHKRLSLGSIYNWIEKNYPYYINRGQGWRNSVRHNLSLNDCFIKAGRCEDGKGNYWAIHPANIQDFMRGDFRQRRRSRRRGRKKECELGMYHVNGYSALTPSMPFNHPNTAFSSIYSPYTDAERRAYRLDEALLRQSMSNPFMKWYPTGVANTNYPTQNSNCNSGMYSNTSTQWQGYGDQNSQSMQSVYQLNSPLSRYVSMPVCQKRICFTS